MSTNCLIIIPCLNEEEFIETLVKNLIEDIKDMDAKIVIADGGSIDKTAEIAQSLEEEFTNVKYLHNPKMIQGAAINLAVQKYGDEAQYLIRIDAHADYPISFCQALLEEAHEKDADSVVVSMNTLGELGFQKAAAAAQNSKLGNGGSAHRNISEDGQWVDHGHHALMSIKAFRAVGGYDENFSHNEDAELDIRLTKAGYKIWLTTKTDMVYYPRSAAIPLFKQYYKFGKGRARNMLKHKTRPQTRQMIPLGVAPAVVLGLLLGGLHIFFALPLLIWAAICIGYGVKLALGHKDKELAMTGPALMIMHLAWSLGFWMGVLDDVMERDNDQS